MLRKIVLIFVFMFLFANTLLAEELFGIDFDNPIIAFDYGVSYYDYSKNYHDTFGLTFDFKQGDISKNLSYSFGYTLAFDPGHFYMSAPGSVGFWIINNLPANSDSDNFIAVLGLFLLLVPENFSLDFSPVSFFTISLALHPWGVEFFSKSNFYYSNGASCKLRFTIQDTVTIAPFVRYRYIYAKEEPVVNFGGMIGIKL